MKHRRWQQIAAAALIALAAGSARSELSFESTDPVGNVVGTITRPSPSLAQAGFDFGSSTVQPLMPDESVDARAFRLSAADQDLSLWAFMTTMRRLQRKEVFGVLESNARLVELSAVNVAPVPLPGAAWLMVMGLSGLAGMRLSRRRPTEIASRIAVAAST